MSYYANLEDARAIIAAAEAGEYDAPLGITPAQRDVLTRAADPNQELSLDDFRTLIAMNEHERADDAHRAGRININPSNGA